MCSRLVCQLLANGHLTALMSHIAAVNTRTTKKRRVQDTHTHTQTREHAAPIDDVKKKEKKTLPLFS